MNSHGIMMSGEMVRAWLNGWKWNTRRTRGLDKFNQNPDQWEFMGFERERGYVWFYSKKDGWDFIRRPPYGNVGDQLYFKETWMMWEREEDGRDFLYFRADDAKVDPTWWTEEDWTGPNPKWHTKTAFEHWQSAMLMPKMCARIHVPITGVRVERLHQISPSDIVAEGIGPYPFENPPGLRDWYFQLWDKLNSKKMPASRNPWLWVYEFEKNKKEK